MAKALISTDFTEQLREIGKMDFDVSMARGFSVIQQTKRNQLKNELMDGLYDMLSVMLDLAPDHIANVYHTPEGVAIEVENESVGKKAPDCNGMITMMVDIKFKNLDYDAMLEQDLYNEETARKEKEKETRAAKKAEEAEKRKNKKKNKEAE